MFAALGGAGEGLVWGWLIAGWLDGALDRQRLVLVVVVGVCALAGQTLLVADVAAAVALEIGTALGIVLHLLWRWRLLLRAKREPDHA